MKVGDYVRTKDGVIAKITDIIDDYSIDCDRDVFDLDNIAMMEIPYYFKDEYIIKSSSNIIDLIEVGDVIKFESNGVEYICDVFEYMGNANRLVVYCEDTIIPVKTTDESVELKSIVTHERFSQVEYRIGD